MKHKTRTIVKRWLAMLLCLCMIFPSTGTFVASAEEIVAYTGGLCEHHIEHTEECGYVEEKEGQPCIHEHTEECYETVSTDPGEALCTHIHDDSCGYVAPTEGTPCVHEHTEDCFAWVTECVHEHTDDCYAESDVSGNAATPFDAEERELVCDHVCSEESSCITRKDVCQHEHDGECGYSEGTEGKACTHAHDENCGGLVTEESTPDNEETKRILNCAHADGEHDEDCGYEAAVEGKPCTFVCEICKAKDSVEIQDFSTLPDEIVTQTVPVGTLLESLDLPEQLGVTDVEGTAITIPVTWESEPEFDGQTAGEYIFSPVLPEDYTVGEGVKLPAIKVIVGQGVSMLAENSYVVGSVEEYEKALGEIQKASSSEATIVLTEDITPSSAFIGVEGKTILIRSQDNERHLLTFTEDILKLSGPLTFEKIHITPHTIYANGQPLVLGEGFGGGDDGTQRMTVYGGSDQDLTADTDLTILDGVYKLISGGNSDGTLTGDTYVEFGGNAQFPTAADGELEGDFVSTKSENYNLYLDAKGEEKWSNPNGSGVFKGMDYEYGILPYGIYGGGTCGNTNGSTEVVMTGGTVYQIFGGGAARRNPSHVGQLNALDDLGRVSGNTSVTVTGGEVRSVYGGGYNDIFVYSSYEYDGQGVPEDAREQRAVVEGNTYVEISGDAHVPAADQSEDTSTSGADCPAVYGGSFHSTVHNTEVVIGGKALIECGEAEAYGYGAVYGAGSNDIVRGTTSVKLTGNAIIGNDQNNAGVSVVSQGQFSAITPMGRSSKSQCYLGGAIFSDLSEIQNKDKKKYAAVAEVSGGSVDVLMAGVKSRKGSGQPLKTCDGNVQLKQSGGSVLAIESGSVYEKNLVIEGDVDILITGGTTEEYILGRYRTSDLGDSEIKGACTLTFSGCGSGDAFRMSPLIWAMDSVQVKDNAHVAVFGDHTLFDSNKNPFTVPLYQVQDLTIDDGSVLAFSQEANITGDLAVNGALHMARVKKTFNIGGIEIPIGNPRAVTLTADGTAVGQGFLLPIEAPKIGADYGVYFEPVVDEEYVYAQTADSNMELTLAQGADRFFVDRKNSDTAGQDVWFINEGQPAEMITVTYQWKGGDNASVPKDVTLPGPDTIEKGSPYTAKQVTSATHTFDGWYLDESYTQKFTDGTRLDKDITLYGNWRVGTDEILWYNNVYIQKADGTYSDEPSIHGQGGWAAPDAEVSISADDFDGTTVEQLVLGTDVLHDAGHAKERLSAERAIDAGKHNPLRIYYKRPYTVTYEYEGTVPQGAPELPAPYYACAGETVEIAAAPTMEGYVFDGWKVKSPEGQSINDGKLQSVQNNVVLTGKWTKEEAPVEDVTWWKSVYYQSQSGGWIQYSLTKGGKAQPDTEVSISEKDFNGTKIESTGGVFGKEYVFDADNQENRLSAKAGEATRSNPLKIYYKLYKVTYEYEGTVPQGAPELPQTLYTWEGAEVEVAEAPTMDGYVFSGWRVKSPEGLAIQDGKLTMPKGDVILVGAWNKTTTPIDPMAAVYKVEHYKQQDDGSYKLSDTDFPLYGEIGKTVTATVKSYDGYSVNNEKSILSGVVVKPVVEDGEVKCLILKVYYDRTDTPTPPDPEKETGDLTVSKTVSGSKGNTTKEFTFTVTLGDTSINGNYGEMVFHDGITVFTLKHGESKTASGLPAGIRYTIAESDNSGYTVTAVGDSGIIEADKTATAAFHNYRGGGSSEEGGGVEEDEGNDNGNHDLPVIIIPSPPDVSVSPDMPDLSGQPERVVNVPKTSDVGNTALWIGLMAISGIGLMLTFLSGKKKRHYRERIK